MFARFRRQTTSPRGSLRKTLSSPRGRNRSSAGSPTTPQAEAQDTIRNNSSPSALKRMPELPLERGQSENSSSGFFSRFRKQAPQEQALEQPKQQQQQQQQRQKQRNDKNRQYPTSSAPRKSSETSRQVSSNTVATELESDSLKSSDNVNSIDNLQNATKSQIDSIPERIPEHQSTPAPPPDNNALQKDESNVIALSGGFPLPDHTKPDHDNQKEVDETKTNILATIAPATTVNNPTSDNTNDEATNNNANTESNISNEPPLILQNCSSVSRQLATQSTQIRTSAPIPARSGWSWFGLGPGNNSADEQKGPTTSTPTLPAPSASDKPKTPPPPRNAAPLRPQQQQPGNIPTVSRPVPRARGLPPPQQQQQTLTPPQQRGRQQPQQSQQPRRISRSPNRQPPARPRQPSGPLPGGAVNHNPSPIPPQQRRNIPPTSTPPPPHQRRPGGDRTPPPPPNRAINGPRPGIPHSRNRAGMAASGGVRPAPPQAARSFNSNKATALSHGGRFPPPQAGRSRHGPPFRQAPPPTPPPPPPPPPPPRKHVDEQILENIKERKQKGQRVNEYFLRNWVLMERRRNCEELTMEELQNLKRFETTQRRVIADTREFQQLLVGQKAGESIDEEQLYYFDLLFRRRQGEKLQPYEITDVKEFEEKRARAKYEDPNRTSPRTPSSHTSSILRQQDMMYQDSNNNSPVIGAQHHEVDDSQQGQQPVMLQSGATNNNDNMQVTNPVHCHQDEEDEEIDYVDLQAELDELGYPQILSLDSNDNSGVSLLGVGHDSYLQDLINQKDSRESDLQEEALEEAYNLYMVAVNEKNIPPSENLFAAIHKQVVKETFDNAKEKFRIQDELIEAELAKKENQKRDQSPGGSSSGSSS